MPDLPIAFTYSDWDHALPDADAKPGTYCYTDGCTIIKRADGDILSIPNGSAHRIEPITQPHCNTCTCHAVTDPVAGEQRPDRPRRVSDHPGSHRRRPGW